MVEAVLRSISNQIGAQNNEFRKAASNQSSSLSKFVKDISGMFGRQQQQQSGISKGLSDLQATSLQTNQNVGQTNDLLTQSISLQSQMLDQLRNVNRSITSLVDLATNANGQAEQQGGGGAGSMIPSFLGGAGLGAAFAPEITRLLGGFGSLMNNMGFYGEAPRDDRAAAVTPSTQFSNAQQASAAAPYTGGNFSVPQMRDLALSAGFNQQEARILAAIGQAESSGNPGIDTVQSGLDPNMQNEFSVGLFQINWKAHKDGVLKQMGVTDPSQLTDPKINAEAARRVYLEAGGSFRPWATYTGGDFRNYLLEGDETGVAGQQLASLTPQNQNLQPYNSPMSTTGGSVYEKQKELAGIRKLPLSDRLKSVLQQAASAAGVDVVVYSGGQAPKGSGGPRTGSTRHDHGNAADLYLMRDGRKLSDTNEQDRAIMAKFVSAATAAGATGVGAGHGYMGPSNIHVGFGNPATWGGAPWIKSAAAGVYNNQDMSSSYGSGGYGEQQGGGMSGMGGMVGMDPLAMIMGGGLPMMGMNPFSILGAGLPGLIGGAFSALVSGLGNTNKTENTSAETETEENIALPSMESKEADDFKNALNFTPAVNNSESALDYIKTTAISQQNNPQIIQQAPAQVADQTMPVQHPRMSGQGRQIVSGGSSTPWYMQMAGRIDYSREMPKFIGGVIV